MERKNPESQFMLFQIICFGFGIGLYLKIILLLCVGPFSWLISGWNRTYRIIWGRYLKKYASNIFGNYY